MKKESDRYHRWVSWSEEDQSYLGRCPDLFAGGIHGDDPIRVAKELQKVIDDWDEDLRKNKLDYPPVRVKPTMELA
jgi:predicted RNase H-like HicB family nuclease